MRLAIVLSLMLTASLAQAAPKKKVCNDLKVTQCRKREDCSWVKKSKDGKKAHCRISGKKKAKAKK